MAFQLTSFEAADNSLMGESRTSVYTDGTATNGIADLGNAFQPSQKALDVPATDGIRITVPNHEFDLPVYLWTALRSASAGNTLSESQGTGQRVYSDDGSVWILVGRTTGNHVLVQTGTYTYTSGTAFSVGILTTEFQGGLLDHRLDAVGARRSIVMEAFNSSRPGLPVGVHDTGRSVFSVTVNGVTWNQAGKFLLTGSTTRWFAFGESVYEPLQGRWIVEDSWQIVNGGQAANIQFGGSWVGPWIDPPYVFGTHIFARVRRPDGTFVVYSIKPSPRPLEREWKLLSQTYVGGSPYRATPYTTTLAFDFVPSEWKLMKVEWEWEDFTSTAGRDKTFGFLDPSDIIVAPIGVRSSVQFEPRLAGQTWTLSCRRNDGISLARSSDSIESGHTENLTAMIQFESDANGGPPATVVRFIERGGGCARVDGWLRLWVL